ncbi:class I adenylate-forming enzyme family protein [Ottowia thiooxydans]|uniref:Acyl-CoA synthetase n=1 Tax=Ottowia thiooxydans TaxID=219182 RepID=A0ABV2QHU7_9BURK
MSKILTLHEPRAARTHYLHGTWAAETLYSLAHKHAQEHGDAFALRDAQRRLRWSEVLQEADCIAQALDNAGLRPGDRVSVWLPNRAEVLAIFLACSRMGYVCNPSLHENYTVAEVVQLTRRIGSRALFAQAGYGADAALHSIFAKLDAMPSLKAVYALETDAPSALPEGAAPFPRTLATPALPAPRFDADQVVYIAFTSGTTGEPKGVMHSDNTLLANGRPMVADWRLDERTVILTLSPMSHHIGVVAMSQWLVAGCELAVTDRHSGIQPLQWIEQTGATYVLGVPTHAMDLLRALDARARPGLGQVSVFYMAGAPIPREIALRLLQLGITPQNVYGMTETGSHQYTRPGDDVQTISATCGTACRGYEVRLFRQDDPDIEVAAGEVGEIGGRGGVLMLGYFADQQATEQSFNAGGWFMSGDLGQFDAQGNLQVVGRKKDLINRGGHKIHPARIEDLAYRHPEVAKAAAFAVPDERLGEKVCLAIVPKGLAPSCESLLSHLARLGLSRFDMPEYYVVAPEFPLTASGKVLKRELVAWVDSGRLQPMAVRHASTASEN